MTYSESVVKDIFAQEGFNIIEPNMNGPVGLLIDGAVKFAIEAASISFANEEELRTMIQSCRKYNDSFCFYKSEDGKIRGYIGDKNNHVAIRLSSKLINAAIEKAGISLNDNQLCSDKVALILEKYIENK